MCRAAPYLRTHLDYLSVGLHQIRPYILSVIVLLQAFKKTKRNLLMFRVNTSFIYNVRLKNNRDIRISLRASRLILWSTYYLTPTRILNKSVY